MRKDIQQGMEMKKNKTPDLDSIDLSLEAPLEEPARQYYFMAKARKYVKAMSEKLGRPLFSAVVTFGCQMNPATMTA